LFLPAWLSHWFQARAVKTSLRAWSIAVVPLARKLLVAGGRGVQGDVSLAVSMTGMKLTMKMNSGRGTARTDEITRFGRA
jgi:hypothetical protein